MKKLVNILLHPLLLLFVWAMYLLSFASGTLRYYYIQNPAAAFPFLGNIAKIFWHTSPAFLVFFIGVWSFWTWRLMKNEGTSKRNLSYYTIGILSIIIFFFANHFLNLEASKYGNYLYVTYGITKMSVYLLSNTSLVILALLGAQILYRKNNFIRSFKLTNKKIVSAPAVLILVWYSLLSFTQTDGYLSYAKSGYEKQFENYKDIISLKNYIGETAKIVLPLQSATFPAISNPPIVRYFLFPRTLVSSKYITDQKTAISLGKIYFITLHKDREEGWPIVDNQRKEIIFMKGIILKYSKLVPIKSTDGETIYEVEF